ncbi:GDSL esterase/lipase At5g45670-like [Juglans microcarpa x Juglans regia]|uniref:GDSL esterase/lipase At5g45670-like n=1 Tax=Juglans microcarpa x Juglans regia TaxID=2249226 RepID=UPI001B7E00B8|nr:GDSL esterase/lipase At5g45670-like [Juglans microcarpa x Juglans regia]
MARELKKMGVKCVLVFVLNIWCKLAGAEPQVPCYFIFGDSLVDNGNNNQLQSLAKVNYRPYGIFIRLIIVDMLMIDFIDEDSADEDFVGGDSTRGDSVLQAVHRLSSLSVGERSEVGMPHAKPLLSLPMR